MNKKLDTVFDQKDLIAAVVEAAADFVHSAWDGMVKPTYPSDHKAAMRVPKGGSSCASCEYLVGKDECSNKHFQKWNGSNKLPAPADEYCSDWYEPKKKIEAGGPGSGRHQMFYHGINKPRLNSKSIDDIVKSILTNGLKTQSSSIGNRVYLYRAEAKNMAHEYTQKGKNGNTYVAKFKIPVEWAKRNLKSDNDSAMGSVEGKKDIPREFLHSIQVYKGKLDRIDGEDALPIKEIKAGGPGSGRHADPSKFGFHGTEMKRVSSIIKQGILPQVGKNSLGDLAPAAYVGTRNRALAYAVGNVTNYDFKVFPPRKIEPSPDTKIPIVVIKPSLYDEPMSKSDKKLADTTGDREAFSSGVAKKHIDRIEIYNYKDVKDLDYENKADPVQVIHLNSIKAYGTSEGVTKSWDTRGRSNKEHVYQLKPGQTTEDVYRKPNGEWDEDRAAFHKRVIDSYIQGKTKVNEPPEFTLLGGGTASGKTTLSNQILGNRPNTVRIDPDEIKKLIPEYAGLKKSDPEKASFRVHEESSYLSKAILAAAAAKGLNITLDSTSSGGSTAKLIPKLASAGYHIHALFADIPVSVAKQRSFDRANNPSSPSFGRYVPDDVLEDSHKGAAANFMRLKDMPEVSSAQLFDNTDKPLLVYGRAGKSNPIVFDDDRWSNYQRKARGTSMEGASQHKNNKDNKDKKPGHYTDYNKDIFDDSDDIDDFSKLLEQEQNKVPADEYCSDWYEPKKKIEAGGPGSGRRPTKNFDPSGNILGKQLLGGISQIPDYSFKEQQSQPVTNVNVADLRPVQSGVIASVITKLMDDMEVNGYKKNMPVDVIKFNGKYVLLEGHHRATAWGLLGNDTVPAKVLDLGNDVKAGSEDSLDGDKEGTLWKGIWIKGFTGPQEEGLRAMLSRIPPELLYNVKVIKSAIELNAKHGRYDPETKEILFNPTNFSLRERLGKGDGWLYHAELTVVHEVGHSIYESLAPEQKTEWNRLGGWQKGWKQGQAPAYEEKRPGWGNSVSEYTHIAGLKLPRYYSERNPNECFSDCFAYYILGKQHQMEPSMKNFIASIVNEKVKAYPQVNIH
jgi:predicted ABC-type ATPase